MNDEAAIRDLAQAELRTEVRLEVEYQIGQPLCSLTIWRQARLLPSRHAAILESDQSLIVTTRRMANFEKLLQVAKPSLDDLEMLKLLISKAAPPQRGMVETQDAPAFLEKYRSVWHQPEHSNGRLTFFANDFNKGKFEKVEISDDYQLSVTVIGPGKKIGRR